MLMLEYIRKVGEFQFAYSGGIFPFFETGLSHHYPKYILKDIIDEETGDVRLQQVLNPEQAEKRVGDDSNLEKSIDICD